MKVAAYCARSFADAAKQVIGFPPLTCPPIDSSSFDVGYLESLDFFYVDLHGVENWPAWYGDGGFEALRANQLTGHKFPKLVVFAANCYLADQGSPMLQALLDTEPIVVFAAPGKNFSPAAGPLYGAALLGQWTLKFMNFGFKPQHALAFAKVRVSAMTATVSGPMREEIVRANTDAQEFQAYAGGVIWTTQASHL